MLPALCLGHQTCLTTLVKPLARGRLTTRHPDKSQQRSCLRHRAKSSHFFARHTEKNQCKHSLTIATCNPHNEPLQEHRQSFEWVHRAPECLAFPRETVQKSAHWREPCSTATSTPTCACPEKREAHGASWPLHVAEGMTESRKTTCLRPRWPGTTNQAFPCSPDSSGYAHFFRWRA